VGLEALHSIIKKLNYKSNNMSPKKVSQQDILLYCHQSTIFCRDSMNLTKIKIYVSHPDEKKPTRYGGKKPGFGDITHCGCFLGRYV
jgi:hypothetical protein